MSHDENANSTWGIEIVLDPVRVGTAPEGETGEVAGECGVQMERRHRLYE